MIASEADTPLAAAAPAAAPPDEDGGGGDGGGGGESLGVIAVAPAAAPAAAPPLPPSPLPPPAVHHKQCDRGQSKPLCPWLMAVSIYLMGSACSSSGVLQKVVALRTCRWFGREAYSTHHRIFGRLADVTGRALCATA